MSAFSKTVVILMLLSNAGYGVASSLKKECRPLVQTFFQMPLKERMKKFGSYELEEQYRIFICGNQVMHPPAIYLAGPFAQQGAPAVVFLKEKLANANDDLTIRDIVLVFTEMKRRNTYDVAEDQALITLIAGSVEKMQDKDWKRMTQENLTEILQARH